MRTENIKAPLKRKEISDSWLDLMKTASRKTFSKLTDFASCSRLRKPSQVVIHHAWLISLGATQEFIQRKEGAQAGLKPEHQA
jgi:hypothetical protein